MADRANLQIIRTPGGEELVILPKADYEALVRAAEEADEDAADVAIYDARKAESPDPLPAELSALVLGGLGTRAAVRKWRGITQVELANTVGISQGALSDIEGGRREPSAELAEKLAMALDVPTPWIAGRTPPRQL